MNKSNHLYYTNDSNELLRRDRDFLIHQQKLEEIKRSKSAIGYHRSKSIKLPKSTNIKDEMVQAEIFHQNQLLATNLKRIHARSFQIPQKLQNFQVSIKSSQTKEHTFKILDENINLCKRILDQQSQIDFKQKLQEYKQHKKIKFRLQKVKRQFEQQEKLAVDQRFKSKSFSQVQMNKF
ncbi:unnamed protein product (macronuclear) [Paramecium tetraurelia]|uniref:Uncharacterized protein n=1 Tax=Paramecium tetraurelia TaxID=5888 RepID=A0DZY1_PARTE|nr:uncharacterized protein GSPATT00021766001 [Paramecium tetraurelia]CAK88598.1 unnamed protein product [Paramecium tetraurelia]|eukprot:XP_001455995.1 hypothetical protein (macronuclear) [Paramecium tetraurelia strain d4-2]